MINCGRVFRLILIGGLISSHALTVEASSTPVVVVPRAQAGATMTLEGIEEGPSVLAAQRLQAICRTELKTKLDVLRVPRGGELRGRLLAACGPFTGPSAARLTHAGIALEANGRLAALAGASLSAPTRALRRDGWKGPTALLCCL